MGYRTVFDVTRVGFQWWIPLLMFIFGAFFVVVGWAVRTSGDKDSVRKGTLFQVVGTVGFLGAVVFFISMYWEYRSARKAFEIHPYSVSEGVVSDFIPMPPGGHSTESFVVNGVRFEYGSGWGSTTFNSEWNKGFIHNGVEARITYLGKGIIKVEVK
ncbi:MAG: hypothetical protein ACRD23_18565 [Terriglobales bacterium]